MSYFTAVLARSGTTWRAVDVDLEDVESLDEMGELLRGATRGGPVLAVLEREDDWFALVRVDEDADEPRGFVSDLPASERSHYAQVLAPIGDVELDEYVHLREARSTSSSEQEADEGDEDNQDVVVAEPVAPPVVTEPLAWAGDPGLLGDVGVGAEELVELLDQGGDPASVLAAVGERCGFDDLLDALR